MIIVVQKLLLNLLHIQKLEIIVVEIRLIEMVATVTMLQVLKDLASNT